MENLNRITIVDVRELPMGQPLETPLHPKRRRLWQQCDQAPQSPQPPQAYGSSSNMKAEPSFLPYSTDPLQENEMEMGPSSSLSYSTDPLQENEMVAGPSSLSYSSDPFQENDMVMMVSENVEIKIEIEDNMPVSPQREIVESAGSSGPSTPSRSGTRRRRMEDCVPLGYGSEPESEESDEEEVVGSQIPRAFRSLLDTPLDDEPAGEPGPAPTATDRPWSLFDFHWEAFPTRPVPPESRRERFLDINGGPTTPCVDPYDIFVAIWDRQFVEYIASETNRYAQQLADQNFLSNDLSPNSRISRWCDTTADELYVFFGIIIAMGVVVKSRVQEYWSSARNIFNTPGFSTHMALNRFLLLSKCLHFNNNEIMRALRLGASEAKLFKIQPVLTHLNNRFASLYYPSRNISIDESLLMWKGWLDINQFIPNKAARVGIKSYELCESQTGYLWRFEIHAHKRSSQQSGDPLNASTPATVLRLLQGLENRGHTVWMDSFYNSPILARRLKCLGFDCVGTLRTNRKFVPQELHSLSKNDMRPGQLTGLTAGDVDVMVWRDNSRVAMLSTYHGNAVSRDGESTKPILILDYNIMMGGVDKKDQLLAMYPIERKRTRVWYKKLFRRLLNVSILNSYVIHKDSTKKPLSHRNFRVQLVLALLAKHCERSPGRPPVPPPPPVHLKARVDVLHRIAQYQKGDNLQQRRRRLCVVCRKRITTYCVGCSKTVCIADKCFVAIHS